MPTAKTTYKKTNIPWISEIPAHWESFRLGSVFVERIEKVSDKDFAPLSVTMKGVVPQLENIAKTSNGDNRKKVYVNDFVINSRSDRKGSGGMSIYDGSVSLINTVLKPNKKYNNRYTNYLFTNILFQEEFYKFGKGIVADMWSTKYFDMKYIKVPCPPLSEQTAIAGYLDRQVEKINHFIKKKRHYIALLEEKRQAIINQAVTQGINANAALKNSGIEGLGEIPAHWQMRRLKYLGNLYAGLSGKSGDDFLNEKKVNKFYIPFTNIANNTFINVKQLKKVFIDSNENQNKIEKGDLLFLMSSETSEDIGKSALVNDFLEEVYLNSFCRGLRITSNLINAEYLVYLLNSNLYRNKLSIEGRGFTRINLKKDNLMNLYALIPPKQEQTAIVSYIKTKTAKIDCAIAKVQKEIELIQEYKEAMIAEAVLGKFIIEE